MRRFALVKDEQYFLDRSAPEPNTGCWIWMLGTDPCGYGRCGGKLAHRVAYEALRGPIASGLQSHHVCRVPCCINPKHMELLTHDEHRKREAELGSIKNQYVYVTHCPQGHALSGDNLVMEKSKAAKSGFARRCRKCGQTKSLRNYYKRQNKEQMNDA